MARAPMELMKKVKSKTWGPGRPKTNEPESRRDKVRSSESNAHLDSHPAAAQNHFTPAPVAAEASQSTWPPAPSTSHLAPPKLKPLKKVTSLLHLRKPKTEPATLSQDRSPTEPGTDCLSTLLESTSSSSAHTTASDAADPDTPTTAIDPDPDVAATKHEIRALNLADVASAQNALRLACEARDTGIGTLARLNEQGARVARAELRLQDAGVQTRIAGERIRELKQSDKMLVLSNPFFASKREREAEDEVRETRRREREERDALRARRWREALRKEVTVCLVVERGDGTRGLVERAKYQFEPDEEDDAFEEAIGESLEGLGEVVPVLRELAVQMGEVVQEQNERMEAVRVRADEVDGGMVGNRYALGRIH